MRYYVYAIISGKDSRIYVGMSSNVEQRLFEHNSGKTPSTKAYLPWQLIFTKELDSRIAARKEEKRLKSGYGKEFLKSLLK